MRSLRLYPGMDLDGDGDVNNEEVNVVRGGFGPAKPTSPGRPSTSKGSFSLSNDLLSPKLNAKLRKTQTDAADKVRCLAHPKTTLAAPFTRSLSLSLTQPDRRDPQGPAGAPPCGEQGPPRLGFSPALFYARGCLRYASGTPQVRLRYASGYAELRSVSAHQPRPLSRLGRAGPGQPRVCLRRRRAGRQRWRAGRQRV